jgi:hypothetical protein
VRGRDAVKVTAPATSLIRIDASIERNKANSEEADQKQERNDEEDRLVRLEPMLNRALHVGVEQIPTANVGILLLDEDNESQEKARDEAANVSKIINPGEQSNSQVHRDHNHELEELAASLPVVRPIRNQLRESRSKETKKRARGTHRDRVAAKQSGKQAAAQPCDEVKQPYAEEPEVALELYPENEKCDHVYYQVENAGVKPYARHETPSLLLGHH